MGEPITKKLIAPCGMDCGVCVAYLRKEKKCPGCYTGRKVNDRPIRCSRKLCEKRKSIFCYDCDSFPCESIKKLDERYRKHYGMSQIGNLEFIRDHGMDQFLASERKKYVGVKGTFCVHDKRYYLPEEK